MGIRSLLRKVFGRDRSEPNAPAAASVPPQSERADGSKRPSPTVPSPADRAADLVSAAFDNPEPRVPSQTRAETSADPEAAAPAGENAAEPEAATPAEPEAAEPKAAPAKASAKRAAKAKPAAAATSDEQTEQAAPAKSKDDAPAETAAKAPASAQDAAAAPAAAEAAPAEPAQAEAEQAAAKAEASPAEAKAPAAADAPAAAEPTAEAEPVAQAKAADAAEPAAPAKPKAKRAAAKPRTAPAKTDEQAPATTEPAKTEPVAADEATQDAPAEAAAAKPKAKRAPAKPKSAPAKPKAEPEVATPADAEPVAPAAKTDSPAETAATAKPKAKRAPAKPRTAPAKPKAEPVAAKAEVEAEAATDTAAPVAARAVPHQDSARVALAKAGLEGTRARVYLVLDRSGSMRGYFKDGSAQRLGEQALGLAANLGDPTVGVVFFSTEVDGTGELTAGSYEGRIDELHESLGRMGRTNYHVAVEEVLALHAKTAPTAPAFVIFQTDGAPESKTAATAALAQATDKPVFWQFVAFGEHDAKAFDYLRKLSVDNAGFFHAGPAPRDLTDAELYDGILGTWKP